MIHKKQSKPPLEGIHTKPATLAACKHSNPLGFPMSYTKRLCSSYHLTTCMHINKTDDQRGILLITHHLNGECSHLLLHNRIFSVQLVAELSKCPVLEKDQRFLPQGTFLQSSRQATKAHHILQDVSFSLLGLWRLLTFPSFWSYFPWWFYGFTTILKTLG